MTISHSSGGIITSRAPARWVEAMRPRGFMSDGGQSQPQSVLNKLNVVNVFSFFFCVIFENERTVSAGTVRGLKTFLVFQVNFCCFEIANLFLFLFICYLFLTNHLLNINEYGAAPVCANCPVFNLFGNGKEAIYIFPGSCWKHGFLSWPFSLERDYKCIITVWQQTG